jgi:hypothetical protein
VPADEWPSNPPYKDNLDFRERLWPPGAEEPDSLKYALRIDALDAVLKRERRLIVFGRVTYRDALVADATKPDYESRFCLIGEFKEGGVGFFYSGPEGWNRYT